MGGEISKKDNPGQIDFFDSLGVPESNPKKPFPPFRVPEVFKQEQELVDTADTPDDITIERLQELRRLDLEADMQTLAARKPTLPSREEFDELHSDAKSNHVRKPQP